MGEATSEPCEPAAGMSFIAGSRGITRARRQSRIARCRTPPRCRRAAQPRGTVGYCLRVIAEGVAGAAAGAVEGRRPAVRILITVPWGERLGGAEAMLQTVLDGAARERPRDRARVLRARAAGREELRGRGLPRRGDPGRAPARSRTAGPRRSRGLARLIRAREPDLILNWAAKTQLYGSPAAVLAGMADRVVWWQQAIPDAATGSTGSPRCCPRAASAATREAAAERAGAAAPARARRFVVAAGAPRARAATRGERRRSSCPGTCRSSASSGGCSRGRGRTACCARRRCCASAATRCTW